MQRKTATFHSAFTLIELVVVIVIIGIVIAVLFPALGAMRRSARTTGGQNAVKTAIIAARAYATRDLNARFIDIASTGKHGQYSGVAALFTPANEIRLVENTPYAVDHKNKLLEIKPPPRQNGYIDIPGREYIRLPSDIGVMGIRRGGSFSDPVLRLLAPPFAVRFNERGQLIARSKEGHVYYDGDYNGVWTIGSRRPPNYAPHQWDPEASGFKKDSSARRYQLPFEQVETVAGVIVYEKSSFHQLSPVLAGEYKIPDSTKQGDLDPELLWLLGKRKSNSNKKIYDHDRAVPLFFSRSAGTVMRN